MPKARIAIFISGTGTNMAALLYASLLDDSAYEVVLIASNNADAEGLNLAKAEGVPTFVHSHKGFSREDHDAAMEAALLEHKAEYLVLAGYMRILSDSFVRRWEGRILNIHPSLLPKYKGLNTHQRAIEAGDSHTGASVHVVTPELDAGEVLAQAKVTIRKGDTAQSLADRVKFAEHQLYPRAVASYVSRSFDCDYIYQQVRNLALALPETHEKDSHGSPGFRVGTEKSGKFFAHFSNQHHGVEHIAVLVKTSTMDELLNLIEEQPDVYFKPAYYGTSGWVGLILNRANVDWDHVGQWLERSWHNAAPARLTKLRDTAEMF